MHDGPQWYRHCHAHTTYLCSICLERWQGSTPVVKLVSENYPLLMPELAGKPYMHVNHFRSLPAGDVLPSGA